MLLTINNSIANFNYRSASSAETGSDASAQPERSLTSHRNMKQTALPLPATGDPTGPKACPREEQPRRRIEAKR